MDRDQWIEKFSEQTGVMLPTAEEAEQILELAGIAAHASERTAAPIACWMAGQTERPVGDWIQMAKDIE